MGEAILVAVTGPLVAAVLAATGFWLRGLYLRRDVEATRQRKIKQASERIALIERWLAAHEKLAAPLDHEPARKRAIADLEQAFEEIESASAVNAKQAGNTGSSRRIAAVVFLRDIPPSTIPAKMLAILYYISLAWFALWLAAAFMFGATSAFVDDPGLTLLSRMVISIGISLLCLAVGISPSGVLLLVYRASVPRKAQKVLD